MVVADKQRIVHHRLLAPALAPAGLGENARCAMYSEAHLLLSAASAAQFPADEGLEVAIAGRSNAGKSTALNALTGRRALARVSKTPGRTRLINFFELAPGQRVVDLPGYGYAAGARGERDQWAALMDALIPRRSLRGLMLVVDARRGLQEADEQLIDWAHSHQRLVHVLLSKCDQLRRNDARVLLTRVQAQLRGRAAAQLFSAREGTGLEAARELLAAWLGEPEPIKKKPRQS
jgi:GTP-binding protein